MKNKFFVFPQLALILLLCSLLGIISLLLCILITNVSEDQKLLVTIVLLITSICLVIIDITTVCIMLAKIGINEEGITRYLFGKKIKFFSWDSICEIKGLNNDAYWIVFCNKIVPDEKLIFSNRKSYTIPIHKRQEVVDAIKLYCPKERKVDFKI